MALRSRVSESNLPDEDKEFWMYFSELLGEDGCKKIEETLNAGPISLEKLTELSQKKIAYLALNDKESWDRLVDEELSILKELLS